MLPFAWQLRFPFNPLYLIKQTRIWHFIVMEYVGGASLAEKVKTGPLPEKEVAELGAQIADALEGLDGAGDHYSYGPGLI